MQHSRRELTPKTYRLPFRDNDSGIGLDYDYSSASELDSSTGPSQLTRSKMTPFPIPGMTGRKLIDTKPLIRFPSDGVVERIRPITLKNSRNSDFIICQTNRGTYVAHRTPIVPLWIRRIVHEVELRERYM